MTRGVLWILLALLAGCSAEESAAQAFSAFRRPCDRHSFKWAVSTNADGSHTFTAVCMVKP